MSLAEPSQIEALHRLAGRLQARAQARLGPRVERLPTLLFVTDPVRTPDPASTARRLPAGSGIIYRAFGDPDARRVGRALARIARERDLTLLVGADPALARVVGAHGVHLPERLAHRLGVLRAGWPDALLTCAAHSRAALARAQRHGADAAVLSPVFASDSPSAGAPLGWLRFSRLVRAVGLPVYALGGVDQDTARMLVGSGAVGLASVSALTQSRAS